jgi:3-phenylpropionate/trans-cinnamate dioxygenase ferredoxin reductase subunit
MADARTAGAMLADLNCRGGRVAVIGGGFIGCEVASTARSLGVEVTVIEVFDVLLQRALGRRYGSVVTGIAEAAGVDVRCGESVEGVVVAGGRLAIRSRSGEVEADMVVVAAGMIPNTELLEASGVALANGAIVVDEYCRTSVANVFAAGDVVCQVRPGHDTPIRVEHQDTAQRQGRVAALAMLGMPEPDPTPDWFWSDQFGLSIQSVGRFDPDGDHVLRGTLGEASFTAFQTDGDRLIGALSIGRASDIRTTRRLIASGAEVDLARLGEADSNLKEIAMARSTS